MEIFQIYFLFENKDSMKTHLKNLFRSTHNIIRLSCQLFHPLYNRKFSIVLHFV